MRIRDKEWETNNSSLAKIKSGIVTYEECRKYACEDIVNNLTRISKPLPFVIELPVGADFHFFGRVYSDPGEKISPKWYYEQFTSREFIAFSTINRKNISRYRGKAFFVYDILPEDIVHIFPLDSDTNKYAAKEEELTNMPSFLLTLSELEDLTLKFGVYNQVTCKTKRNGEILKPFAIVAFDRADENLQELAIQFGISIIISHPNEDAIEYKKDLLYDYPKLKTIAKEMYEKYGLEETIRYVYRD